MKIDIIYRCCGKEMNEVDLMEDYPLPVSPKRSSRPNWFNKKACYKSVWDMTNNDPSTFSMHVFYDFTDGTSSLLEYIQSMRVADGAIYKINRGANDDKYYSIQHAYDYADKLTGDWIYFVEDDYLHTPDAARVIVEGTLRFEMLSLYDHLDRYTRNDDITDRKERVALTSSCHWRTAESTCHTWAISRPIWDEIKHIARKHGANDRSFFYELIDRDLRLWTPIPARSTHCVKGYMSPLVDWDEVAEGVRL